MTHEIVKEEGRALRASINLFNKANLPHSSTNYLFISKAAGDKARQRNDKDIADPLPPAQVNNARSTKTKSTLHKEMIFKYEVALPPHSLFHILSHHIRPDNTSNRSNSTGWKSTSNHNLKIWLVTLYIANNNNNNIAVSKAVNEMIKVIYGI